MWPKFYRDYPVDDPLKQQQIEPGKGIIGCEMHDLNGWGESYYRLKKEKKGRLLSLFSVGPLLGDPQPVETEWRS